MQIAFVTPEWLFNGNKLHQVQMLSSKGRIGLIAIDEAHLVFDWATFRSKYSLVESIKEDFPNIGLDLTRRKRPLSTDSDDEFAKTQKPNKKGESMQYVLVKMFLVATYA